MKPYYQDSAVTIYHGDCREILPSLPKVDLVLTDPPYGIKAASPKRGGTQHGQSLTQSREYGPSRWDDNRIEWILEIIIGHSNIVWGGNYYADILGASRGWLVWDKETGNNGYADCELAWTDLDMAVRMVRHQWKGMFKKESDDGDNRVHPTQKPVDVMKWCLGFVPDAETIIDPFMGSGTTLRAAKDLGRKAIGIELEERYCEIAARRMQQECLPLNTKAAESWQPTEMAL